ncbi:hypothetical protein LCGC14_2360210, partial [marine sediment metagenome]
QPVEAGVLTLQCLMLLTSGLQRP